MRSAQLAQTQHNFPLPFLTTLHLRNLAAVRGWDRLLMSARDCYLWCGLYDRLRQTLPDMPPASYFYTSRTARAYPSPDYLAYFASLRSGRRNVVVDLIGTGWSLRRLIEEAPEPKTEIFLLHWANNPDWLAHRAQYGGLKSPIDVVSVVQGTPPSHDIPVLEQLNLAPHASVEDVRAVPQGFQPVLSPIVYTPPMFEFIESHHQAFARATQLAAAITKGDLLKMADRDLPAAIEKVYGRFVELRGEFGAYADYRYREEQMVWQRIGQALRLSA